MKKNIVFFFLMISVFGFSQKSNINLDKIKKEIQNQESIYFYEKMVYKFQGLPKSIDSLEAIHLYYGRNFINKTISTNDKAFKDLLEAFKLEKYDETAAKAKDLLFTDPTNLDLLMVMLQCYDRQKDIKNFSHYYGQFQILTRAMLDSGDGKSEKSAYLVNSVGDEYILINVIQIPREATRSSKPAKGGMFDIWENNNKKTYIKVIYNDF
ncbi:DUF4919 domain-containing protein [Epilithonimonas xixisoli]|uniref:Uncharacterized protein DUF4919 n=1 Tax=Epilithonimonas xixisoli TaxID=1476462 RepID=A0A4V3H2L0_9FLAO|nr:DUF4919 domain-containing protein [Epilithonimonas xixisoli]TDX84346.1 uncharacterized protein DUF4919 [Epilithonimonas xixisoli]